MSIVRHEEPATGLVIEHDQTRFTDAQIAALAQIGVDKAGPGDLDVFFHVCKRSGLDPFARQIHMVGRNARTDDGQWVTKYTIQTGIDGYRLIGRRAADRAHQKVSVEAPQWAHPEGGWRDVWSNTWGRPLAARVTIRRDGEPFTAVAMFDEYAQTKRNGDLNSMWSQRPAGQIAKCAEALAWRMAFPQDLSGIYTDEEMAQADNHQPATTPRSGGLAAAMEATQIDDRAPDQKSDEATSTVVAGEAGEPESQESEWSSPGGSNEPDPASPPLNTSGSLAKAMYAAINAAGIPQDRRLEFLSEVTGREIGSSKELTEAEARMVLDYLPQQQEAQS